MSNDNDAQEAKSRAKKHADTNKETLLLKLLITSKQVEISLFNHMMANPDAAHVAKEVVEDAQRRLYLASKHYADAYEKRRELDD